MNWVYILKCEDDRYYIGETKRLFRRFWEHMNGTGGKNTSTYCVDDIIAIYRADTICKFIDYDEYINEIINENIKEYKPFKLNDFNEDSKLLYINNLDAENYITECMMINNKELFDKIKGGKYTKFNVNYQYPSNKYINLPICKCKLPCDIRKNEDENYLYFRCAKKNIWNGLIDKFDIDNEPCNFFMEYTKDKKLKIDERIKFENRKKILKELFKKSRWLKNVELNDENYPKQCIGGCYRTSASLKLTYSNQKRNLCFDCFIEKNDELKNKYNACI